MIDNITLNDYKKNCSSCEHGSCTIYTVLFVILFVISVSISSVFIYFNWYSKRKHIETTIYWMQNLQNFWMKLHILLRQKMKSEGWVLKKFHENQT